MAQFLDSFPRGGDTYFDAGLRDRASDLLANLNNKQSPIRGGQIYFHQYEYDRNPVLSAQFLDNYVPFKVIGMALSASDYSVIPTHSKPVIYNINSYKSTARNDNDNEWPLQHARDIAFDLPYGWDYDLYDRRGVCIIHTTEKAEQKYADGWLTSKGAVMDTLLSSMLMPTPDHTIRFFRDPARIDRVFITANKISVLLMHKIVAMLPILFSIRLVDLPIVPPAALFNSFTAMDADAFIDAATEWIEAVTAQMELQRPLIARALMLANIAQINPRVGGYLSTKKTAAIKQTADAVTQRENELRDLYIKLRDLNLLAQTGTNEDLQALADFLPRVQDLAGMHMISDYKCGFAIHTAIQHYSCDEAQRIMMSRRARNEERLARVLEYVFYKEEYRILISQGFFLNFRADAREAGEMRYGKWAMPDHLFESDTARNPHITHFGNGCWGDNATLIDRAIVNGAYLTAFNTALSAVRSVNLSDGTAMNNLYERLLSGAYGKCIQRVSDGARFDIEDFLQETDPIPVVVPPPVEAVPEAVDLVNEALDAEQPVPPIEIHIPEITDEDPELEEEEDEDPFAIIDDEDANNELGEDDEL